MILVDTSVWIDYFNGIANRQTDLLHDYLETEEVIILDIILVEILQGFRSEKNAVIAESYLKGLSCYQSLNPDSASIVSKRFRELRRKGITVRKTIDLIIAGWCLDNNVPLLENDKDFLLIQSGYPLKLVRSEF